MSKGLKLEQFKEPAFSSDILNIDSKQIYINAVYNQSNQLENIDFKCLFSIGAKIKKNNIIASKKNNNNEYNIVNIFADKDCEVQETKYLINENDKATSFIVLKSLESKESKIFSEINSKKYQDKNFIKENILNNFQKSNKEILDLAYQASIIDETDGVYLFEKLQKLINNKHLKKIYIDAIDDQPFTSSKESILLHYNNAIDFAIFVLKKAFDIDIDIIFYDIEEYNREKNFLEKSIDTHILHIKGNYPVRHSIVKKLNYNLSIGIQAILHLARALIDQEYKHTTTFLTVSGPNVINPQNIEVPIGTTVEEIIENFNLRSDTKRIILGQAITGVTISEIKIPISVTTRSILVFSDYNILKQMECIGCSRCSDVCPQNLLPSYRYKFKTTGDLSFEEFSSESECLKCYCCSYICPSHINLV